jgi:murein DD-endopeptidase MepM/ murein hydrolase activator NlpD
VTDEAASDVVIKSLLIDGEGAKTELIEAITDASLRRSIDEVPTMTIEVRDPKRSLLRSGVFSKRITTQLDNKSFELAQVRKSGSGLSLTFEDLAAAELRRHDAPLKVEAGTMTRIQFARRLLQETPWIPLVVSPTVKAEVANVELARGTVAAENQQEDKEDTWTCLKRVFGELNWRCYIDYTLDDGRPGVNVGPDSAYLSGGTVMTLKEAQDGVDDIDFDWDVGKPVATARLTIRAHRWQAPPGTPVTLEDVGPANGKWIVTSIERSLFSTTADVELKAPEPDLPEPPPPDSGGGPDGGDVGSGSTSSNAGGKSTGGGFIRPGSGPITSPFGDGRGHKGIDIGTPMGAPVVASKAGTVTFAGSQSGYGNVVYISHGGGVETRYGHLSAFACRRGMQVSQGQRIGSCGATGNARGAHIHFEIRINGSPVNPAKYV